MSERFLSERVELHGGDCLAVLPTLAENSIDSCVCDPPYHLQSIQKRFAKVGRTDKTWSRSGPHQRTANGFMNKVWDGGDIAFRAETWVEVYRVLKPGAHLIAFGGTRNYHRMACAIEDAGFEIRDSLAWLYGTGFPKSQDVSKFIDKELGVEGSFGEPKSASHAGWIERGRMRGEDNEEGWQRPWMDDPEAVDRAARRYIPGSPQAQEFDGFGTALKPAYEPIVLARKPLSEKTVAANVLRWRTGALNIDACRVGDFVNTTPSGVDRRNAKLAELGYRPGEYQMGETTPSGAPGRWPANVVHDGSEEVIAAFPETASGELLPHHRKTGKGLADSSTFAIRDRTGEPAAVYGDRGSAARFFFSAKANGDDRIGSKHPTVKPVDLKRWLCRLVTPPGGVVLDLFAGTGTTGEAAWREGLRAVLIEREAEYQNDIRRRMKLCIAGPDERARESMKANGRAQGHDDLPLFLSPTASRGS